MKINPPSFIYYLFVLCLFISCAESDSSESEVATDAVSETQKGLPASQVEAPENIDVDSLLTKSLKLDNGHFELKVPGSIMPLDEMLDQMKTMNENMIFLAMLDTIPGGPNPLLSASKYTYEKKTSMKEAWDITVNTVGHLQDDDENSLESENLYHDVYDKDGKTYYIKASAQGATGTVSIMYQFMKDEYDYNLYELKMTVFPEQAVAAQSLLEGIATTVKIK